MYRLWIIALSGQKLIFTRHFPHLEKRDAFNFPTNTNPTEFTKSLFTSLGIDFKEKDSSSQMSHNFGSTNFSTDSDFSKLSRSSSSSSLSSLISTTSSRAKNMDASESASTMEFSILHNYLPLIMCRFMNNPRESGYSMSLMLEEPQKFAYRDLLLLIFEKNGYLFVCCPRLCSHVDMASINQNNNYEQLLLEEQNISLSYSSLQLLSSVFFAENKSVKHVEMFISSCMPFGTLINDGFRPNEMNVFQRDNKINKQSTETLIRLCINEFASTSFQSFSRTNSTQNEAIFGTLVVDSSALTLERFNYAHLNLFLERLNALFVAKPVSCSESNGNALNFDLKYNKLDPFNILHYRLNNSEESSKHCSTASDSSQNISNKKLFTYLYVISKKDTPRTNSSFIFSPKNCHHISVSLSFNSKIQLDALKFDYFAINFSLGKTKSKNEVQTIDSSIINLIIRDSIKASSGQVRSEGSKFIWLLPSKMHRSEKVSLEFDLLIEEDKLANLETMCNFRYDHKVSAKMSLAKMPPHGSRETNEVRECVLKYPVHMMEPKLLISKAILSTEMDPIAQLRNGPLEQKTEHTRTNTSIIIEYRMTSYEYRLFPLSASFASTIQ